MNSENMSMNFMYFAHSDHPEKHVSDENDCYIARRMEYHGQYRTDVVCDICNAIKSDVECDKYIKFNDNCSEYYSNVIAFRSFSGFTIQISKNFASFDERTDQEVEFDTIDKLMLFVESIVDGIVSRS